MATLRENIEVLLDSMSPIDLSEMKGIKLMNRVDTKFIATEDDIVDVLWLAKKDYRVQEVDGKRIGSYDTIYYDTDDVMMYVVHHNQMLQRQKIRTRTYVDSGLAFLEIKNKNNRGRTKKVRTPIELEDFREFKENPAACDFIYNESRFPLRSLSPHVRTKFERITLVNERKTERLTIDMALSFENMRTGEKAELPGMAIVELKQDGLAHSEMKDILTTLRIKPQKISKYCVGTVLTNHSVPSNRFKEKIIFINKLLTK